MKVNFALRAQWEVEKDGRFVKPPLESIKDCPLATADVVLPLHRIEPSGLSHAGGVGA